jgi:hypothetical protein
MTSEKKTNKSTQEMIDYLRKIRNKKKNNKKTFKTTDQLTVSIGYDGYEED